MNVEVMKQALQALEGWAGHGKWIYPESALEQAMKNTSEAIPVLRAAIQQAEEPHWKLSCGCPSQYGGIPAEWATTDRDGSPAVAYGVICEKHWHDYDAQHPKVRQEPVAWVYINAKGRSVLVETNTSPFEDATPLYTHPPQSEWQGLTAEEFDWILNGNRGARAFIKVTEARLKEKNT